MRIFVYPMLSITYPVMECSHDPANVQQTSSKLPANVFKIHVLMLDVC